MRWAKHSCRSDGIAGQPRLSDQKLQAKMVKALRLRRTANKVTSNAQELVVAT
jgi:hypothetical protein